MCPKVRFDVQAAGQWREPLTALLQQAARALAVGLVDLSAAALLGSLPQQAACGSDSQRPKHVTSEAAAQPVGKPATHGVKEAGQSNCTKEDYGPCGLGFCKPDQALQYNS